MKRPPHIWLELGVRLVIGFLLALALAGCDRQKGETPQGSAAAGNSATPTASTSAEPVVQTGVLDRSHAGTPAPAVKFVTPTGEKAGLEQYRGKPLLVNLWATWCGPCVTEMPKLDALAARDTKLQVMALSQDSGDDAAAKVKAFFATKGFGVLQPYLDSEGAMTTALKLDTLPTTILYDKDGKEVWRMVGMVDWTGDRAAKLLMEGQAT